MPMQPTSSNSLHHAPLIIDAAGLALTAADRRRLADPRVGGVIHFARNWQDRAQLAALNAEIKAIRPDLLICVDHEGGRVQRFRSDGFTRLPAMRALGELCARDPSAVTLLAKSLMHGLLAAGMANCGKHFPGHGHVRADSHTDIPVDDRGLKTILADDAAPYGWLGGALSAVMPAHVIYPRVDARPAGFSARWLVEILRDRLGFAGAIFSDDLSMAGARVLDGQSVSYAQAAVAALKAGCDMVLLCNQSAGDEGAAIDELMAGLAAAERGGHWQPSAESEARRRALLPVGAALSWDALLAQPAYRQAVALLPAAS